MPGQIDILNCGTGHSEVHVDTSDPIQTERASRIIQDMLKRGYALFVHGEGDALVRVQEFDPKQNVYIIGAEATLPPEQEAVTEPVPAPKGKPGRKKLPVGSAKVTAVGRSAGG